MVNRSELSISESGSPQLPMLIPMGMRPGLYTLLLLWLVIGLLTGCSMVQTSMWTSFVDDLDTGSKVEPERTLIDAEGILNVHITKAASPEWEPDKELEYPYAGVMMFLRGWGKPMDLSEADGVIIEYRLSGDLSLKLIHKDIPTGAEYTTKLEPCEEYTTVQIPWSNFSQPTWIQNPVELNLSEMIGLMFANTSEQLSTTELSIRSVSFSNWENPDYPHVMLKNMFQAQTEKDKEE